MHEEPAKKDSLAAGHHSPHPEGIWAAVHTPFADDRSLDESGIAENIDIYTGALGIQGIFFNGLFGEYWSLTLPERKRIVEVAAKAAAGSLQLSPNCTHHSLYETIELAKHAEQHGCAYVVLMNPSTGPRGEHELYSWFEAVAESVDSDLIIFNSPVPGYALSARLICRLAELDRFKIVKAAGGSHDVNELRRVTNGRVIVSDPSEGTWLGNLVTHDQRLLYADAEPFLFQSRSLQPMQMMFDAYRSGNLQRAVDIHKSLRPLRDVYEEWITEPIRRGIMSCAAIKFWARHRGLAAGPVRAPLHELTRDQTQRLDAALRAHAV